MIGLYKLYVMFNKIATFSLTNKNSTQLYAPMHVAFKQALL